MNGGKNKQPFGYTIIEVMVVLAVSGFMFLIASQFIGGKQETTSFNSGVNDMAANLQDIVSQVADGQYSNAPVNCTFNGSVTFPSGTSPGQGANSSCVFLGKLLYFSGSSPLSNYQVMAVAGGRVNTSTGLPITLLTGSTGAQPRVVQSGYSDLTTSQATPQSLDVTKVLVTPVGGAAVQTHAFGFFQSQGTTTAAGNGQYVLQTGSQNLALYYYNAGGSPATPTTMSSTLVAAAGVDICLTDETRYADLLFGNDSSGNQNGQLNVSIENHGQSRPALPTKLACAS